MTDKLPLTPDWIIFATVGSIGDRTFHLQCATADIVYTYKMEKQQVIILSDKMAELLKDAPRPGHLPDLEDIALRHFDEENFVVGTIAVAYDLDMDRFVLILEDIESSLDSLDYGDLDDEDFTWEDLPAALLGESSVQLLLTREQAAALSIQGTSIAKAGRPPCPLCGYPLDPRGHACPRTNGNKPPRR